MPLELRFKSAAGLSPVAARIVLNRYITMAGSDLPCLTAGCVTMGELEGELLLIEQQIASIRTEAKRRFVKAGISN